MHEERKKQSLEKKEKLKDVEIIISDRSGADLAQEEMLKATQALDCSLRERKEGLRAAKVARGTQVKRRVVTTSDMYELWSFVGQGPCAPTRRIVVLSSDKEQTRRREGRGKH